MATICRLCATLKKIDNFVRLNDPSLNLSAKIEKCCQLYIDTNDSLPQNVCTECVQSLDDCWKFVTKVIEAQESLAKIFHSDETLSGEPSKKLVEKLKINVTSTKIDIDKEEQASESRDDLSLKLENFDDVYEIAEVHLENEHEYITEEEISEEHTELGVDVETMEIISEEQVKEETVDSWHNYPWICCSCSVILSSQVELKIHYSSEHKDDGILKYTCADCSKVIDKYYAFINHVKSRHREHLLLSCDVCAQTFKNVVELADHRLSAHPEDKESSEELVLCPICGKAFRNQTALQIHANCHQPDDVKYKFACNVCEKKFGSKPNLKAHQKIHSGLKDFVCDQCGKSFVQKANLEEHLVTHINDTPYTCGECNKRFKTPARLTKHKLIHTDIKPYKCEICGRVFREKDTLKVHSRIHTGAMPYECEFCGKRFRFKSVLSTHRHQHTGERPYSCIECNHHFTNWPNYNKHMKRRHGINTSSTARKSKTIISSELPQNSKPMSSTADSASDLVSSTAEIPSLLSVVYMANENN